KGRSGVIRLYRVSRQAWGGDTVVTATPLQQLPVAPFAPVGRLVTGAAIRPDGRLVAIRTYTEIYTFVPGAGGLLTPSGWPVCNVSGLEPQGEAIAFLDDSTFVLASEAAPTRPGLIHAAPVPRVGQGRCDPPAHLSRRFRSLGGAAGASYRRRRRGRVRRLRRRSGGVAVGRLQGHGRSRQSALDARERSRPPGLDRLQRAGPDLLRPLDLQARRSGASWRGGRDPG